MMSFPPDYPKQIFACLNREAELKGYRFDLLKAWNRLMSHEILVPSELGVSQVTVGLQTFHVGCVYTGHKADSKVGVQLRCVPSYSESYFKPPRIIPDGRQCVILSLQKGQEGTWFAWVQPVSQEQDLSSPPTKSPPKNNQGGYVPLEELQPFWDRSERCASEAHARGTTYYAGTAYEVARGDSKTRTKLRCCAALVKTKRSLFNPSRAVADGAIVVAKLFRQSPADGVWFAWIVPLENARRKPDKKKKEKKNESGFIRVCVGDCPGGWVD